jgi:hypothetical protein
MAADPTIVPPISIVDDDVELFATSELAIRHVEGWQVEKHGSEMQVFDARGLRLQFKVAGVKRGLLGVAVGPETITLQPIELEPSGAEALRRSLCDYLLEVDPKSGDPALLDLDQLVTRSFAASVTLRGPRTR